MAGALAALYASPEPWCDARCFSPPEQSVRAFCIFGWDLNSMVYDSYVIPSTNAPPQMKPKLHTIKKTFPTNTIFSAPFMVPHFLRILVFATDFADAPILISW
jgi:hypothetical protein